MSQVIDLSENKYAQQAGDNIVKIIEASAKAKQSQVDLQKQLLLDQITRARNRQDKQLEQQDQMNNWGKMFGQDSQTDNNGMTNQGVATGATPSKVGTSPIQPIGGEIPQGGYTADNPPPMSMADGSNQAQIQQMQQKQQEQPQPQPIINPQQKETPASQLNDLGFKPIGIGQLAMARKGQPEPKDFAYVAALNKAKQGTASEGELDLIRDFNGYKGNKDSNMLTKLGIDTVNLTPDQIGQELQSKNPGHYAFLKSIKDGEYKVTGRSSKEMNKVVEEVQTIWPGTDLQALQARYDTRKDFTSGKTANNITALNTALSHLDKLATSADTLDNGAFRFGNKLGNIIKTQTGDSRVRVLGADIHAVTGELAGTFKQTGATDTEIKNFEHALDSADSKEVVKSVVNEFIGLIGGRTQPLLERWQNAFGQDSTFPVVGKNGAKVLAKHGFNWDPLTGEISQGTYENNGTGPTGSPEVGTVDGGYKFKGGDPSNPNSWEKI